MIAVLCNGCNAWLSDFFNTNDTDSVYEVEAVLKLMICEEKINAREWEESVRTRSMDAQKCEEAKELEKCVYEAYQDPVAEYIKHLIYDAQTLCENSTKGTVEWWRILILVLAICIVLIILALIFYYLERKKRIKLVTIDTNEFEDCPPCGDCDC